MSNEEKIWLSATELSLLGESFVADLPKTMQGVKWRAKKGEWGLRKVKGGGGPGGVLTEYQPPAAVLALIQAFLEANPDFFTKSKNRKGWSHIPDREQEEKKVARLRVSEYTMPPPASRDPGEAFTDPNFDDRLRMLMMVLRVTEVKLSEPPDIEVAKKAIILADAWLPFASNFPDLKERLEALKATASLFI